jgi:hypothetical protein
VIVVSKTQTRTLIAISVCASLTACGGGGGGGGGGNPYLAPSSSYTRSSVPYYTPVSGGSYRPLTGDGPVIQEIYTKDLNKDNVDEVVMAGRMSQPATIETWKNYDMQIYGWNTGSFKRETSTWFSGTDNRIMGTEPSVKFGDFNGDGEIDMFVAHSTDMRYYGPGSVFFNTGTSSFTKTQINLGNVWSHDSAVIDLNSDGFSDILVTDYQGKPAVAFGSAAGTFSIATASSASGASGVSIADYLGNGTKTIVFTDAASPSIYDTKMYSWAVSGDTLSLTEIYTLPASRFYLPKWDSVRSASATEPHDIRNLTMDFNRDGRPDVIVISSMPYPGNVHGYSEVQFLENRGNGIFIDVTDSVLAGYDTASYASYQPRIIDINQDGLLDILLSASDTDSNHNSSRVLLATSDGKYVQSYLSVFQDFYNQTVSMTRNAVIDNGQTINVAAGPNGDFYLITYVNFNDSNGNLNTAVYAARINSNGTASAQATLDIINTSWPYLSGTESNSVLAQTASLTFNGMPVIDWMAALNPVGDLGISLNGRQGQRLPIVGSISVPGLDRNSLSDISSVDSLGRHFQVNLTGMSGTPDVMPIQYSEIGLDVTQNWSSRLVSEQNYTQSGMSVNGNAETFSFSMSNQTWRPNSPWVHRVGMARLKGSPWVAFSGIFGSVQDSTVIDFSSTRLFSDGMFAQAGVMQTSTNFTPGLVTAIDPLWAGYFVAGRNTKDWSMYGGMQPTLFSGNISLRLPTSVDSQGIMHYTERKFSVRNDPVMFIGAERRWVQPGHTWRLNGVINDTGDYQARVSYSVGF